MSDLLEQTQQIARDAGGVLMSYFGSELTRDVKSGPNDFATEADRATEELILEKLEKHFPDDDIVTEESGTYKNTTAEYTWIIDPLDGTYPFANQHTNFGVMITRARGPQLELCVVYYPALKITITAQRGTGASLEGRRVTLADQPDIGKPLCVERTAYPLIVKAGYTAINEGASKNTLTTIQGQSSAYISNDGKVWDFAPPALLLEEAGYTVTNFAGDPYIWNSSEQNIVAAPARLHQPLLEVVKGLR